MLELHASFASRSASGAMCCFPPWHSLIISRIRTSLCCASWSLGSEVFLNDSERVVYDVTMDDRAADLDVVCSFQRSNRRQNQAPGPIPPAQFQPTYGGTGGAPNYQPFDQYQQYPPQPYPGVPPAGGNPAYGGQYSAGAAPIYGGYPPPQTGGYPQQPGGYPPQGRDYAPQTGGTAEMTDFTKPQYAPVNGVRPVP